MLLAVRCGLEEERAHGDRGRAARLQVADHVLDRLARVDDVLHHDHVAPLDRAVEAQQALHLARRLGAGVGGELDEREFVLELDLLDQVAHEHERAVEHPHEQGRLLVGVVGVDTCGDGRDRLVDTLRGNHHAEGPVVEFYRVGHGILRLFRYFCKSSDLSRRVKKINP